MRFSLAATALRLDSFSLSSPRVEATLGFGSQPLRGISLETKRWPPTRSAR